MDATNNRSTADQFTGDRVDAQLARLDQWRAPGFQPLLDALLAERSPIYVVGGHVRDYLLGVDGDQADLDLVMERPVLEMARRVADQIGWAFYPLDRERDVVRLVQMVDGEALLECDIAALRGDLREDLRSRDFTINALALALIGDDAPRLVDLCNGVDDLRARHLRPAEWTNLDQDPLRMLRAVRFAFKLGMTLDTEVCDQIRRRAAAIALVSPERVRDEIWKILNLPKPGDAIDMLRQLGLLAHVLPEVAAMIGVAQSAPHHLDVYAHTLLVVDHAAALRDSLRREDRALDGAVQRIMDRWQSELHPHFAEEINSGHSRGDWLVWHALFHDVGKPSTRSEEIGDDGAIRYRFFDHEHISAQMAEERLTAFRFGRREIQLATSVIAAHMRPHSLHNNFAGKSINRRAAYRFFRSVGGERAGVDVLILCIADRQATGTDRDDDWRDFINHMDQLLEFGLHPLPGVSAPLIDGRQLLSTFHLKPGPTIGYLLAQIGEAQATGEIHSAEDALALAAQLLHQPQMDESD